jgi:dihydrodipicolinate synthase/N-acetylneuraminate lyase
MQGRLLQGVYVPLITPFAADGSVARDALERLGTSCSTRVRGHRRTGHHR